VEAVESIDLHEADRVTRLTYRLAFRDQAGRDHMDRYDRGLPPHSQRKRSGRP
jgi:hypothetical protein